MKEKGRKINQKRRAGRVLALIMTVTLLASLIMVPQKTYAASMAKKSKTTYRVTVHNINSNTVLRKGARVQISYTATKTKNGVVSGTKVKFKSSKKKVASVSKSGVITAKKNGTAKITVYCKKKPGKKKTIKIRVGTPVSSISVSGDRYLRVGRSSTLKASANSGATNKSVSWWSDNPGVVTVNGDGKIRGISSGSATVYATAKDGSGVSGSRKVYVHQYYANEANWIAHRGLHTSATENTARAFLAAAQSGGFWGCECDIWETRHVPPTMPALPGLPDEGPVDPEPDDPTDDNNQNNGDEQTGDQNTGDQNTNPNTESEQEQGDNTENETLLPDVTELKAVIEAWPGATSMDILEYDSDVKSAWSEYYELTAELDEEQLKQIHKEMITEQDVDLLAKLFNAYSWVMEYDSIDLAINHNATFAEIWGNGNAVRNMSAYEIRTQLPGVCFLSEYLDICKGNVYNTVPMVPVIEFKDPYMSAAAINKALDMIEERGLLDQVYLISFYDSTLAEVKKQARERLGHDPITYLLIDDNGSAVTIQIAKDRGFKGVSFAKSLINNDLYTRAKNCGLGVGTWTYKDKLSSDEYLFKHLFMYGWKLDFVTVDYHIFR